MKILLKSLKLLFYFLIVLFSLVIILYYLDINESTLINGYYKDYGSGVTIKSESNEDLFIGGVLDYANDKRYIIVKVFPRINYDCKSSATQYFITKIKYLVIDTRNNKIYGTYNVNKFKEKINSLNIALKFDMTKKELNAYIKDNYSWFYTEKNKIKKMKDKCKEDNFYLRKEYQEL